MILYDLLKTWSLNMKSNVYLYYIYVQLVFAKNECNEAGVACRRKAKSCSEANSNSIMDSTHVKNEVKLLRDGLKEYVAEDLGGLRKELNMFGSFDLKDCLNWLREDVVAKLSKFEKEIRR